MRPDRPTPSGVASPRSSRRSALQGHDVRFDWRGCPACSCPRFPPGAVMSTPARAGPHRPGRTTTGDCQAGAAARGRAGRRRQPAPAGEIGKAFEQPLHPRATFGGCVGQRLAGREPGGIGLRQPFFARNPGDEGRDQRGETAFLLTLLRRHPRRDIALVRCERHAKLSGVEPFSGGQCSGNISALGLEDGKGGEGPGHQPAGSTPGDRAPRPPNDPA